MGNPAALVAPPAPVRTLTSRAGSAQGNPAGHACLCLAPAVLGMGVQAMPRARSCIAPPAVGALGPVLPRVSTGLVDRGGGRWFDPSAAQGPPSRPNGASYASA